MSHFQPQEGNNEYYIEPRASGHNCIIINHDGSVKIQTSM